MATGDPISVLLANLFPLRKEATLIRNNVDSILRYFRYVDDILVITKACFFSSLKRAMSKIWAPLKLEFEHSVTQLNFLDLTVFLCEQDWQMPVNHSLNLRLHTKVYQKPMNLYQYLHWNSNHSRKIYFAIIKGEIIRYLRICSRKVDFEMMMKLLSERLKRRGFPVNVQ